VNKEGGKRLEQKICAANNAIDNGDDHAETVREEGKEETIGGECTTGRPKWTNMGKKQKVRTPP